MLAGEPSRYRSMSGTSPQVLHLPGYPYPVLPRNVQRRFGPGSPESGFVYP
jgi:hypothetical protein